MKELKLPKNQKCWKCKKEIKKEFIYNGHWWCVKCKKKDTNRRIKELLTK